MSLSISTITIAALLAPVVSASANSPALDARIMCPSIYQPVCARKGDESRTFPNACLARGAGFAVIASGSCGGGTGGLPRFGNNK